MAGRIWIPPYKPLGVSTQAVPGGGYINADASAGRFEPSPLLRLGLQVAEGAAATAGVVSEYVGRNDEAVAKAADVRLGEAEQALLFDNQNGYLNARGEAALTQAPDVVEAYSQVQRREIAAAGSDEQQRMLEELTQRRLKTFGEVVERHSTAERLRWHDAASERRIAQMQADAGLHWSDDALLRRALGTTRVEVRDQAERHRWDSPQTETALRQQTSRTLVSAIEAAVERDPGRAQSLRTRYDAHIEAPDRAALDALLSEAHTRQRAQQATTDILNATPPEGGQPTPQWRLQQAEAIAEPTLRTATIRHLNAAVTADEARARALAEQALARVLKDGLTDPSQIPVRQWVALDAERRRAIETRLDHNAAGTEPAPNPALADELATQMTQAPHTFARRDLVPAVAHLPLAQWQRFRGWQAGIRRRDPETEDRLYAIKRGLQLAEKTQPSDLNDDDATNYRAKLVEEIDTRRRIDGKSPDDAIIADMLARHASGGTYTPSTLAWVRRDRPALVPVRFAFPHPDQGDPPGVHRVQDANRAMAPSQAMLGQIRALAARTQRAVIAAQSARIAAEARVAAARAAAQTIPKADVVAATAAAQALQAAMMALEATAREHAAAVEFDEYAQEQMRAWSYLYAGQRFRRILEKNEIAEAAALGFEPTDDAPIDAQGRQVFVNPRTGEYIVRAEDVRTPGVWEHFDELGGRLGFARHDLKEIYPDPPLNPNFPHAMAMTPAQKDYQDRLRAWQKRVAALLAGGMTEAQLPPPPEDPDETPEAKEKKQQEEQAKSAAEREAERKYRKLAKKYKMNADSETTRRVIENLDMDLEDFISKFKQSSIRQEVDTGLLEKGRTVRHALDHATEGRKMQKLLPQKRFDK